MTHLGKCGFTEAKDVGSEFGFCIEHSHNTWWNNTNIDLIRAKSASIRINNKELSQKCAELSTKNFCSLCDGGISTGLIHGLCPHQCETWYQACKHDYFTGDVRLNELGSGEISFCSKNSLMCSKLEEIYSSPTQFCTQMGLEVNLEDSECYVGIPWF